MFRESYSWSDCFHDSNVLPGQHKKVSHFIFCSPKLDIFHSGKLQLWSQIECAKLWRQNKVFLGSGPWDKRYRVRVLCEKIIQFLLFLFIRHRWILKQLCNLLALWLQQFSWWVLKNHLSSRFGDYDCYSIGCCYSIHDFKWLTWR